MSIGEPLISLLSVTAFFGFYLTLQAISQLRFCALCASVSSTWLILLALYWGGRFENLTLIALLMGGSVVGLYYLVEKKTREALHLFRLPFFLTLLFLAYILLGAIEGVTTSVIFLALLWTVFGAGYVYRNNPKMKSATDRLIACCKDW